MADTSEPVPIQRPPSSADLAAVGSFAQSLVDLRYDMRMGLHELGKRLGKIEETMNIAVTEQAVNKLKLGEMVGHQVQFEQRMLTLENSEGVRAAREAAAKEAALPKQYGPWQMALIGVICTVVATPIAAWMMISLARFVATNPTTVAP